MRETPGAFSHFQSYPKFIPNIPINVPAPLSASKYSTFRTSRRLGHVIWDGGIVVLTSLQVIPKIAPSNPHLTPLPTLCYSPCYNRTCYKGYEPEEYLPERDPERRRSLQSRYQRRRGMGRGAGRRTMINDQLSIANGQ